MTSKSLIFTILGVNKSGPAMKAAAAGVNYLGGVFTKVGGIVGGEFGNAISTAGQGLEDFSGHSIKAAQKLQIAGGIVTGLGLAVTAMGSKEAQASAQLRKSIEDSGHSYDKYDKQIEAAIKRGEDLDHNSVDVQQALAKITTATGSPTIALQRMSLVEDLAADKHTTLADAAGMVARILGGSGGRTLKQYGITMAAVVNPTTAVTSAQKALLAANNKLHAAQQKLNDAETIAHSKKTLTVADELRLRNARDAVTTATGGVTNAEKNLATAQHAGATNTKNADAALDQLSAKLKGQASASVDNFGSQVDIVKTKVEDWIDTMGAKFGPAISAFGGVVQVGGVALEVWNDRQATLKAAAEAATTATEAETVAQVGLDGAMDANPIGLVALALGALAAVVGGTVLLAGTQKNTVATADFTTALEGNTAAIAKNEKAVAAKALADSGALQTAARYGISTQLVVSAALGNAKSQRAVAAAVDAAKASLQNQIDKLPQGTKATEYNTAALQRQQQKLDALAGSTTNVSKQLVDATNKQNLLNGAMGGSVMSAQDEKKALDALEKSIQAAHNASPNGYVYEGGTLVPVHGAAPKASSSAKKPHLALGGIVNPRRNGVDVTVGEAGKREAVVPLPSGFDLSSLATGRSVTNVYHVTVKGGLIREKSMIRDLQRTKNRVQLRGGIAKGPF